MEYFNDVFPAFPDLEIGSCVGSPWRDRNLSDFIKNIFICVLKMNKGLTCVEQHEGEYDKIFITGWTNPLTVIPILSVIVVSVAATGVTRQSSFPA